MLSIGVVNSSSEVHQYFIDKDNYYLSDTSDIKETAIWYGKGAEKLGILGERVEESLFLALLEGRLPHGEQIGKMRDGSINHRPATDLTFSAPKSFSIMALVAGDKRLMDVHNRAVDKALDKVELLYAEARKTVAGVTAFEKTNNLTIARFRHTTSRELDAQLHTHSVVVNATQRDDAAWRALSSRQKNDINNLAHGFRENIYSNQHYIGMIYTSELAKGAVGCGYTLRVKNAHGNFEIEGIDQAYLDSQSKRRAQITAMLEKTGYSGAKAAQVAAKNSRQKKATVEMAALKAYWLEEANKRGVNVDEVYQSSLQPNPQPGMTSDVPVMSHDAMQAIRDATGHLSQYSVHISHGDMIRQAFIFSGGIIKHDALEQALAKQLASGEIVGQPHQYYTTRALLDTEKQLKKQITQSMGASEAIDSNRSGLVAKTLKSRDRLQVIDVKGIKNEAKLVDEMVKTAESHQFNVFVLHHNRASIHRLKGEVGREQANFWAAFKNYFKPDLMQTVMHFTHHYPHYLNRLFQKNKQDYIIIIDGQKLAYQDVKVLDTLSAQGRAKVIFLNNTESTQGFRAGNVIKLLKDCGVAQHVSNTPAKTSVVELIESKTLPQSVAQYYVAQDKRCAVVVTTNKAQQQITDNIRARLKQRGELSIQEMTYRCLSTKGLSDVEKTNTKFYHVGDQVKIHPFTKNQQSYQVRTMDRDNQCVQLIDTKGRTLSLALNDCCAFEVKKQHTLAIAVGEQLRTTRDLWVNQYTRLDKNAILTVERISDQGIRIDCAGKPCWLRRNELAQLFVDYAYVIKPYQLQDSDQVLTALESYQINRNRLGEMSDYAKRVTLFTDNRDKAMGLLDKQQRAWLATDVAYGQVDYRPIVRVDAAIRHDLLAVANALSGNKKTTAETAVAYGIAKLGEREAGFKMTTLLKESLQYALGQVTSEAIEKVVQQKQAAGELLIADQYITTEAAYQLEKKILAHIKTGQGVNTPIFETAPALPEFLTQGQKDAVALALTTHDRFIGVQGLAGTGKTTMMRVLRTQAQKQGYRLVGITPTHKARQKLSEALHKHDDNNSTIPVMTAHKFLNEAKKFDEKTVVIADESSMLSNRIFHDLQTRTHNMGGRMIFVGDTIQQVSIESGKPLELSMAHGLQFAVMDEIVRQKNNPILKSAVVLASQKKAGQSLQTLASINPEDHVTRQTAGQSFGNLETRSFIEVGIDQDEKGDPIFVNGSPSLDNLYEAVAQDYLTRLPAQREKTMVVASMHKSRAAINARIRAGLKDEGIITQEIAVTRLKSRNLDQVELLNVKNFTVGDVLRFNQTYSVVSKGDHHQVVGIHPAKNQLTIIDEKQQTYTINPAVIAIQSLMTVHETINTHVGKGDRLRLSNTNVSRGHHGGVEYTVDAIKADKAVLRNEQGTLTLNLHEKQDQHWDHAYTNTTYSAQGDTAHYDIGVEINDNYRSHYIQLSRASHHAMIYTADKAWLLRQLDDANKQIAADKLSAIELLTQTPVKANETVADLHKHDAIPSTDQPKAVSAAEIKPLLDERIEGLAMALLGEPNQRLSSRTQLRFGNKGSLSVNLITGQWYSHEAGQGGGAFELIKQALGLSDFKDVMDYAKRFVNYQPTLKTPAIKTSPSNTIDRQDQARKTTMQNYAQTLVNRSVPLAGSIGENYLKSRGLNHFHHADIGYLQSVPGRVGDTKVTTPALIAFASNAEHRVNHVQVIRLDQHGKKNKRVNLAKQTYGTMNGLAVELNKQGEDEVTYLAEGIETGLSILNVHKKARVLAVLGKSNFANIDLNQLADKVVLCLDNDGVKMINDQMIQAAIDRIQGAGKQLRLVIPQTFTHDFNDVLVKQGLAELSKQINQLLTPEAYKTMVNNIVNKHARQVSQVVENHHQFNVAIALKRLNRPMRLDTDKPILLKRDSMTRFADQSAARYAPISKQWDKEAISLAKNEARINEQLKQRMSRDQMETIARQAIDRSREKDSPIERV